MKKVSFLNSNLSFKENSCLNKVTNNVIKYYQNKLGINFEYIDLSETEFSEHIKSQNNLKDFSYSIFDKTAINLQN
ncbi:hypothetical protein [Mycoplasma sp. 21DD0573]|uniref:hypothetical protein n=1 Tax=unclassified Mycoplasma TaxID=2683645 RepID=UPI002B1D8E2E|nr:hypothetical protein [Mycoplasma sp. 21DD0573]MEA4276354.1 hypothetical protein [Mycoplasma sp. 21DD0573]